MRLAYLSHFLFQFCDILEIKDSSKNVGVHVFFQSVTLRVTPLSKCGWLSTRADSMLNTSEAGAGSNSVVKAPRKYSSGQSLLPLPPNRGAMAGPGYLTPTQDLLEGMEREQLAAGIRKTCTARETEDIPLSPSPPKTRTVTESLLSLVTPAYKYTQHNIPSTATIEMAIKNWCQTVWTIWNHVPLSLSIPLHRAHCKKQWSQSNGVCSWKLATRSHGGGGGGVNWLFQERQVGGKTSNNSRNGRNQTLTLKNP